MPHALPPLLTPLRRVGWALAVLASGLGPSALAGFLILWVMPQTLGVAAPDAFVLLHSPNRDSILFYSAVSTAVVIAVLAFELLGRGGPVRRHREAGFTTWLVVKSCMLTFGWSAAAAFMPWGVMGVALQNVLPEETVPLGGTATGALVLMGFIALLLGTMMALVDYGRPRSALQETPALALPE